MGRRNGREELRVSNEGREEGMGGKKVRRAKKGEGDGAKGREKWQRIREGRIQ